MNKVLKLAAVVMAAACMTTACNNDKTSNINILSTNPEGRQVVEGDLVYGEVSMKFNDQDLSNNLGHPSLLFQVTKPQYEGDLNDCLMQLHAGDHAVITVEADSMAKYYGPRMLPPTYVADQGMKMTFDITITQLKSMDDMMREMDSLRISEPARLDAYIEENGITAKPTEEGLFVIVNKKGNGPKVANGKSVKMHYTGRLLDGTIFDSSIENGREPLSYVVGQMGLIPGWQKAVDGMPEGTELTAIFPSALGYGADGTPDGSIAPFSPLRFDITIVEVK